MPSDPRGRSERRDGSNRGASPVVSALAGVGAGFLAWWTLVTFFSPRLKYRMRASVAPDSNAFAALLEASCPARRSAGNRVEILKNGDVFYPAMLAAIRSAQRSINLEAYVFKAGRVLDAYVDALSARARAGVTVSLTLDAAGSFTIRAGYLARLRAAGCRVEFYDHGSWNLADRLDNRTHRELLIVDGAVAFTGGPGVADYWLYPSHGAPPWRDTSLRLEGPIVADLQGVFAENWLESSGEVLAGEEYYPPLQPMGRTSALVVKSSPADRSTPAHLLFFALIACAQRTVHISTPYFVPDQTMRDALAAAARRGVGVRLLVPGPYADQKVVHVNSRQSFGALLTAGVRIFEYLPSMIHQKLLLVDGAWAVLGTTNMDNRSFELNDEINVAFQGPNMTSTFQDIYDADLDSAQELSLEDWRRRSPWEKAFGRVGWVLDRQE